MKKRHKNICLRVVHTDSVSVAQRSPQLKWWEHREESLPKRLQAAESENQVIIMSVNSYIQGWEEILEIL